MGILKKIFRGNKKKTREFQDGGSRPISDPSFPSQTSYSQTQSQATTRGGEWRGTMVGDSTIPNGMRIVGSASTSTASSYPNNNLMLNTNNNNINNTSSHPQQQLMGGYRSPRSTGPVDTDDEGIIVPENETEAFYDNARNQTQEQLRLAYEMSKANKSNNNSANISSDSSNSSFALTSNQLQQWDHQQRHSSTHQFSSSPTTNNNNPKPVYTMSSDLPSMNPQQPSGLDDTMRSVSSASSFNLSTDAEDSEYENLKRTYYPPGQLTSNLGIGLSALTALDTSAIDAAGSIASYTTDEDRSKIFPNLPTDDDMTLGTDASSKRSEPPPSLLDFPQSRLYASTNVGSSPYGAQVTVPMHAALAINTNQRNSENNTNTNSRNKPGGTPRDFTSPRSPKASKLEHKLEKNHSSSPKKNMSRNRNNDSSGDDGFGNISTNRSHESNGSGNHRQNKSPTAAAISHSSVEDSGFADFGNFADFADFPRGEGVDDSGWTTVKEEKKDSWDDTDGFQKQASFSPTNSEKNNQNKNHTSFSGDNAWNVSVSSPVGQSPSKLNSSNEQFSRNRDTDPFRNSSAIGGSSYVSAGSSSTGLPAENRSLTELLEAAKSKRKDSRRSYGNSATRLTQHNQSTSSRMSSASVNSAPAITASYLRQHHNLGGNNVAGDDPLSPRDGTSVSDIIQSLEDTDRMKRAEQITSSHRSMGDAGVVATARAAKERLRERRRRERESAGIYTTAGRSANSLRHSSSRDHGSDSDESENGNEASESWLFDQVTGAMGPVGIAADLESLSGRSNRSKNSHGGKSHKSSGTSNRRRSSRKTSSTRRHRSDRSVDSHGSRTSRYSHRSTKSFLSQMSEQSRSVANDLLRLEMQLAMVGNNNVNGGGKEATMREIDSLPVVQSARTGMSSSASLGGTSRASGRSRRSVTSSHHNSSSSSSVLRRTKTTIVAPPGKLGIILANKADSKGTVVSGVRTSSVLVHKISPGDRIVAIDGEDVSRMTVSEITTIMSRKAEYERRLTVMTIPRIGSPSNGNTNSGYADQQKMRSPNRVRSSPRVASISDSKFDSAGSGSNYHSVR